MSKILYNGTEYAGSNIENDMPVLPKYDILDAVKNRKKISIWDGSYNRTTIPAQSWVQFLFDIVTDGSNAGATSCSILENDSKNTISAACSTGITFTAPIWFEKETTVTVSNIAISQVRDLAAFVFSHMDTQ